MYSELEIKLFKQRFHGAVNIKGIDFQIHYALNIALNLLSAEEPLGSITLEGIEDVDLQPIKVGNVYVQVKTSNTSWHLCQLSEPLINFISQNNTTGTVNSFQLVTDFEQRESIKKLFSKDYSLAEKANLVDDILKCKPLKVKRITRSQLENIILNTEIQSTTKQSLIEDSKRKFVLLLDIHPDEAENFLLSFLYKFLDWSVERKTITKVDIYDFKTRFFENKVRGQEFEAYGRGLIDRISWREDSLPKDYFEGKKTRFGHIALGLDVRRTKWLNKIQEIFGKARICVIREASGQGKSTLALRYAYDFWNHEYSFAIKAVETVEHSEQISNYLKSLSELGLPVNVLIDDVNHTKSQFANVLRNCVSHPIYFLITSRNDDYHYFGSVGEVSLEFLIPYFDRQEAKLIFQNLKKQNKIHTSVINSDWAYERISSPKCLIEFIFLITQGQMLDERLSEQIREIRKNNQNDKIDFLRKALLADACKTPININHLIISEQLNIDYQELIKSTNNEFVYLEDDYIHGYHWVRTSHLLKILHENYSNPAITALKTISLIDDGKKPFFLGNLSEISDFDVDVLIGDFKYIADRTDLKTYLAFLSGIFKIGEYLFFLRNKEPYQEAYEKFNEGALFLFNSKFLPTQRIDIFSSSGDNSNFIEAKELSDKITNTQRGFQYVSSFVNSNEFKHEFNDTNLDLIGEAMDWFYWIKKNILSLNQVEKIIKNSKIFDLNISSLSLFSQSLYRLYPEKHTKWFTKNKDKILAKLENELKCSISLSGSSVKMTYSEFVEGESLNEATMKRLNIIRSAIPFCKVYKGKHTFMSIMTKLAKLKYQYAHDESKKEVPAENLHFQSDVEKNKIFDSIVDAHFRVKTWYEFTECYYNLRNDIILYCEDLCRRLNGSSHKFKKEAPAIAESILHSYKKMPIGIPELGKPFSECCNVFNYFNTFLLMKSNLVQNEYDSESKRLMFIYINNCLIKLPKMQEFFDKLGEFSPTYFNFGELNQREDRAFKNLKEVLKKNVPNSIDYWNLDTIID